MIREPYEPLPAQFRALIAKARIAARNMPFWGPEERATMIMLCRASDRRHSRHGETDVWLTFYGAHRTKALAHGFGLLERLDEMRLGPSAGRRGRPRRAGDVVTYVRAGALAYVNATGMSGVVHAGEFHRMTGGDQVQQHETNASHVDSAHVFQIKLRPTTVVFEPSHEQRRFTLAERRGGLVVIASVDGRLGSLRLHQDVILHSAVLLDGQHVAYELLPERSAWIHVVEGSVVLAGEVLVTGDGAGLIGERALSLIARGNTELLLLDLGQNAV